MAIPTEASMWAQPMDPADRVDFIVQFGDLLTGGEVIETATVTVLPEAAALGLTIITDAAHGPSILNDTNIEIWFEIDDALQSDPAFNPGASLPVQITVDTDATPPRRFQRTMVVRVVQL
jgi:hypothetical protein